MRQVLDGKLTILVNGDRTSIEVEDKLSSIEFLRIELTNDQLAQLLSRLSSVPVKIDVGGLDRIGKKMEMDKLRVEMPENTPWKEQKETAKKLTIEQCPDGWVPDLYFSSQDSFQLKDGKEFAVSTIRRWV